MMLHHYFFVLFSSILIKKGLKNLLLKKKLFDICRFAHLYDFRAWLDGVHDSAKTSRLKQKNKICSSSILYWLSRHVAFF